MDDIGLVLFVAIIFIVIVITIIAIAISRDNERGDYRDGGGQQLGSPRKRRFFMPANDWAGIHGEEIANRKIRPLLRNDEYLLSNLLIPLKNGYKAEIDSVVISRKGIFCIEIKNWVGHISGEDDDETWRHTYDDDYRGPRQHRNPIRQNQDHCEIIKRKLNNHLEVDNIVIFVGFDSLDTSSIYVFSISDFIKYYRKRDDVLEINEIQFAYQKLLYFVATQEELELHRKEMEERFNNN